MNPVFDSAKTIFAEITSSIFQKCYTLLEICIPLQHVQLPSIYNPPTLIWQLGSNEFLVEQLRNYMKSGGIVFYHSKKKLQIIDLQVNDSF